MSYYIKNEEKNGLEIYFDGKPDENVRNILKSEGFRWAPSQGAWQRQLTVNGQRSAARVKTALKAIV